jgi:hypothetical protein
MARLFWRGISTKLDGIGWGCERITQILTFNQEFGTIPMRIIILSFLFSIGAAEILVGAIFGPLGIYSYESPFARDIGVSSDEQARVFGHYLSIFKNQWSIVSWFGAATIVIGLLQLFCFRQQIPTQKTISADDRSTLPSEF